MNFRNVVIRNPSHLSVDKGRLSIRHPEGQNFVSFEDTASVLLEHQQTTITSRALSTMAENNCAVYVCDNSHLPVGIFLPFQSHNKQLTRIQEQLSLTKARKSLLWQTIIKAKILNQAKVLYKFGHNETARTLLDLTQAIQPADTTNREALAAHLYFVSLFGLNFSRDHMNGWNAALNYGYSIIRGALARSIAQFGLIPSLGIFHHNQFNNFNLADDFIEPFRPFVDYWVRSSHSETALLTPETKQQLISLLQTKVLLNEKKCLLEYATTKSVESYISFLSNSNRKRILLPTFI